MFLRKHFEQATIAQLEDGQDWYNSANALMILWSEKYGCSVEQAAGVTAAISPMTSWSTNTKFAEIVISRWSSGKPFKSYGIVKNYRKAWSILTGSQAPVYFFKAGSEDDYNPVAYFTPGSKTWRFYHNLAGNLEEVTVDGHMINAMNHEVRVPITQAKTSVFNLRECEKQVKLLASELGLKPAVVQAVIWTVYREGGA